MGNTIYIDLPFFDIDTIGADTEESNIDNRCIGDYKHIRVYTTPHEYKHLNPKPKLTCKGISIPYIGTWQRLAVAFPIGKVIKVKGCFYEVVSVSVDVTGKEVLEGTWLTTNDYNATINTKPYGVDTEADSELVINLGVMG